jgi:hypothetical protein
MQDFAEEELALAAGGHVEWYKHSGYCLLLFSKLKMYPVTQNIHILSQEHVP